MTQYEYKTILGNVRLRDARAGETHEAYMCAQGDDLFVVQAPIPPEGNGWELVATSFAPGSCGPLFVAREWRRPTLNAHIEELAQIVERLRSGQFEHYDEPEDEKYSETPRLIALLSAIIDQVKATPQEPHR